jgi:flagellar biosynthesis protein FlhG
LKDQAEHLRLMVRSLQEEIRGEVFGSPSRRCRVITVTSGKGGVGKTNLALGLAITLARAGYGVMLMDGDMGTANVEVVLGMSSRYDLSHVVRGEKDLDEIVTEGPYGLKIVPGISGIGEFANLDSLTLMRLFKGVTLLDKTMDYLFIDTGAGISNQVMPYLLSSREILLVTTPEPTALVDAYSLIKVFQQNHGGGKLRLIVNMARSRQEGSGAARRLQNTTRSFLGLDPEFLGSVSYDLSIQNAVRQHKSYVIAYPGYPAALDTVRIASELGGIPLEQPLGAEGFFNKFMSHFKMGKDFLGRGRKSTTQDNATIDLI